jgi:ATP-dependent protease ClpP protease subunit
MAPDATLMLHDVSGDATGKTADIAVNAFEAERLQNLVYGRIGKACGRSVAYFDRLLDAHKHADYYLSAAQALDLGLATKVGTVRLDTTVVAVTSLHVEEAQASSSSKKRRLTRKKKHR